MVVALIVSVLAVVGKPALRGSVEAVVLRQGSCRISGFESDHTVGVWLTRE